MEIHNIPLYQCTVYVYYQVMQFSINYYRINIAIAKAIPNCSYCYTVAIYIHPYYIRTYINKQLIMSSGDNM